MMNLNICHITGSISRVGGGVSKVVRDLSFAQALEHDTVRIVTLQDEFTEADSPVHKSILVAGCPITLPHSGGYAHSMKKTLMNCMKSTDVMHIHGLWMYPGWLAGRMARTKSVPYIISPHGMLDPRSLSMKKWKKLLAGVLAENRNIMKSTCLHACSELEAEHFRTADYRGPIAVIPSGLTASELDAAATTKPSTAISQPEGGAATCNKRIVLFLSRIHEQKGLDLLLSAWCDISGAFPEAQLLIAGGGDPSYISQLKSKVMQSGMTGSVTFIGEVHGDAKWSLLKKASIFVLPTFSENFGLVVTEALACGVPVITTRGTPWSELESELCGWWIEADATVLGQYLAKSLSLTNDQLAAMGERGRRLIERKFRIEDTARKMSSVYQWMRDAAPVPDCVRID